MVRPIRRIQQSACPRSAVLREKLEPLDGLAHRLERVLGGSIEPRLREHRAARDARQLDHLAATVAQGGQERACGASRAEHTPETVLERVVEPAGRAVLRVSSLVRRLQHGRVQAYVLYILIGLVALAVWVCLGVPLPPLPG